MTTPEVPRRPDDNRRASTSGEDSWEETAVARWLRHGLAAMAGLLAVSLLVAHTFKWSAVRVDSNSLILLGIIAAIPLAGYLRRFRVGDFEAEFYALKRKTRKLEKTQEDVKRIVVDTASRQDDAGDIADEGEVAAGLPLRHTSDQLRELWRSAAFVGVEQRIRNVLWVDDNPEALAIERSILERRGFVVTTARSTREAVNYLEAAAFDVLITDLVRDEGDGLKYDAGVRLVAALRRAERAIPVFVFSSEDSIVTQREALQTAGIDRATASFSELVEWLSLASAVGFENEVTRRLDAHYGERWRRQESSNAGIDGIAALAAGRRVGFEIKAWQRPGPKAIRSAISRLTYARHARSLSEIVLVTPSWLSKETIAFLEENGIRPTALADLENVLRLLDEDEAGAGDSGTTTES